MFCGSMSDTGLLARLRQGERPPAPRRRTGELRPASAALAGAPGPVPWDGAVEPAQRPNLWRSRRYRGIECFFGVPGSGKTYELARWGLEQRALGRTVFCSYGFNLPGAMTFRSIDEFVAIPRGSAICVDEAPIWFDARAWKNMDPTVLVRLTQIRHYDIHLRYTAIDPSMVELRLRQITFECIEHRPLVGPFNLRRKVKSPEGCPQLRSEDAPYRVRRMRPDVCMAYDTTADADTSAWGRR